MVKAIRIERHGEPDVMQLVDVAAEAPGPGHVRVRHHAIGLNFIDVYYRRGLYAAPLPHGLGMEGAGVVEEVGEGVTRLKAGDRVAYPNSPIGSYAESRVIHADLLVKLPKGIGFDQAAAMMLKGLTVQYLLRQTYRLQGNETILFHAAAGGVGLIACQWAKALGVKLIGTVGSDEKAALAKANGAWETIVYTRENVAARVLELTGGKKCPVVYDSVGQDTWETSLDCLQPRGLMVSFGNSSGPVTGVNLGILASKGSLFVTRPTLGHHITPHAKLQEASAELFGLVAAKKIKIDVSRRFALADAAAAHRALEGRETTGSTILIP
jgi:NADPH2:quinone reductase